MANKFTRWAKSLFSNASPEARLADGAFKTSRKKQGKSEAEPPEYLMRWSIHDPDFDSVVALIKNNVSNEDIRAALVAMPAAQRAKVLDGTDILGESLCMTAALAGRPDLFGVFVELGADLFLLATDMHGPEWRKKIKTDIFDFVCRQRIWSAIPHLTRLCEAAGPVSSARASAKFHQITRKALTEGRWEIADQTVGLSAWIESELAEGMALAREKNAHLPQWTAMWERAALRGEVESATESPHAQPRKASAPLSAPKRL